jgi:hypothetical protein
VAAKQDATTADSAAAAAPHAAAAAGGDDKSAQQKAEMANLVFFFPCILQPFAPRCAREFALSAARKNLCRSL